MVLLKLSPIMGCLAKYLLLLLFLLLLLLFLLYTMAGLYSSQSIRFYDLSPLARFCFFQKPSFCSRIADL
jgi:hypothetical protein